MTYQKGQFPFISFSNLWRNQIVSQRREGGSDFFSRQIPSLDVCVAHVEEHAVDVARVAPILVGELVVAGKRNRTCCGIMAKVA